MFVTVESPQFRLFGHAKFYSHICQFKNDEHRQSGESHTGGHTERLDTELPDSAAQEQSVLRGSQCRLAKQPDGESTPNTAYTVNRHSAHWIVDLDFIELVRVRVNGTDSLPI